MQVFIYNRFHTFVGFNSRFKLEMNKTQTKIFVFVVLGVQKLLFRADARSSGECRNVPD